MNADTTDETDSLPPLLRLAVAHGVATEATDPRGNVREVADATLVAVLGALGVAASTPAQVSRSLAAADEAPWLRMLPEAVVTVEGEPTTIPVHVHDGDEVEVWVELEDVGRRRRGPRRESGSPRAARTPREVEAGRRDLEQEDRGTESRTVLGRTVGRAHFAVPEDLPLGWHTLHARSGGTEATTVLVVTPARLVRPSWLERPGTWGFAADLYAVRSRRSWGTGDLADLGELGWLAGREAGADFVLIDPVHSPGPLAPPHRLAVRAEQPPLTDPLSVRVEDIPETGYLSAADRSLVEWSFDEVRDLVTEPGPLDRDAAWSAKRAALEVVFAFPRSTARQADLDDSRAREGAGLVDVATWFAIVEHHEGRDLPANLDDPASPAVAALRDRLHERVELYTWIQWVTAEQREKAQRSAREGGMRLGVVHTLAAGPVAHGADAWALAPVLARGVTLGEQPSSGRPEGLRTSLVPWDPNALRRAGYAPYRDLLRAALRGAGALRVDRVLGLLREWWVPGGARAGAGTWVAGDSDAMIGILCLEAHRAGAVVIGDDHDLDDADVRETLAARGILGTTVLWDETGPDGTPLAPGSFRSGALAQVVARDMPPSAGHLAGEHLDHDDDLDGFVDTDADVARRHGLAARDAMVRAMSAQGLVGDDPSERELVEGLYRTLRATPSVLVAVALADAVGERRAQCRLDDEDYPSWSVPLAAAGGTAVLLEDLFESARLRSLAAVMREPRADPEPPGEQA